MKLSQIMSKGVITVEPCFSLDDAIRVFERCNFRHLPVEEDGRLVGMLSDRDLSLATGWSLSSQRDLVDDSTPSRVLEIMHSPVISLGPDGSPEEAARLMLEQRIGAVAVIAADGHIAGIVTTTDLLRAFRDEEMETEMRIDPSVGVASCMSTDVATLGPDDFLEDAIELCKARRVRHVPILEDGRLIGMASDRDLRFGMGQEVIADMIAEERGRLEVARTPLSALMAIDVPTIGDEESLAEAADRMLRQRLSALPVMRRGRMVGILTDSDILRHCAGHGARS